MSHAPVMCSEVVNALQPCAAETYVDGTFGGGGYTRAILSLAKCVVYGIDRDPDAIARGHSLADETPEFTPIQGCFADLDTLLRPFGVDKIDGLMLDIGVSSYQIDTAERGFSFMQDGPLDMRMGQTGPRAQDVINTLPEKTLAQIIRTLGEEKQARRIAQVIVNRRQIRPFTRTRDLADTVEAALGGRRGRRTHPATLTFQALRIFINEELDQLARALSAAERMLAPGGRLVIVTFHSLEDRLVKRFMRERSGGLAGGSRYRPEHASGPDPTFQLRSRKALEPSDAELADNPRARSARLRAAVRTDAQAWPHPYDTGLNLPELAHLETLS